MPSTGPVRVAAVLVALAASTGVVFRSPAAALVPDTEAQVVGVQVAFASPQLPGGSPEERPRRRGIGDGQPASVSEPVVGLLPDAAASHDASLPGLLPGRAGTPPAGRAGIPGVVLAAYREAERRAGQVAPGCGVRWSIVAGIGRVETKHGMHNGPATVIAPSGEISPPIIGGQLNGEGDRAAIADTDGGRWDGDRAWDRAVGPMQFIPSSWQIYGQDGNGDGRADPNNVFDAALAAADHLCRSAPGNYEDPAALGRALFAYNRSSSYVALVQSWIAVYDRVGPDGAALATLAAYAAPQSGSGLASGSAGAARGPQTAAVPPAATAGDRPPPDRTPVGPIASSPVDPLASSPTGPPPAGAPQSAGPQPADPGPLGPQVGPPDTITSGPVASPVPDPAPSPSPTASPSPSPEPAPSPSPVPSPASPATPGEDALDELVDLPEGQPDDLPAACTPNAVAQVVRGIAASANGGDRDGVVALLGGVPDAQAVAQDLLAQAATARLSLSSIAISYDATSAAALSITLDSGPWADATFDCGAATLTAWGWSTPRPRARGVMTGYGAA